MILSAPSLFFYSLFSSFFFSSLLFLLFSSLFSFLFFSSLFLFLLRLCYAVHRRREQRTLDPGEHEGLVRVAPDSMTLQGYGRWTVKCTFAPEALCDTMARGDYTLTVRAFAAGSEAASTTLELTAAALQPQYSVSRTNFELLHCAVDQQVAATLVLRNLSSQLPLSFEADLTAHFHVEPQSGVLLPNSQVERTFVVELCFF